MEIALVIAGILALILFAQVYNRGGFKRLGGALENLRGVVPPAEPPFSSAPPAIPKTFALDDVAQVHQDARKLLAQQLMANELVKAVIQGPRDQALIATDRRLFIFKKGWLGGAFGGQKMGSWEYRAIAGIEVETGFLGGAIIVQVPGGPAVDRGYLAAFELPNAIPILKESYEVAAKGVAEIRRLLADHQAGGRPASRSLSEELERLAALRAQGQLTEEEFTAMKGRLLAP